MFFLVLIGSCLLRFLQFQGFCLGALVVFVVRSYDVATLVSGFMVFVWCSCGEVGIKTFWVVRHINMVRILCAPSE